MASAHGSERPPSAFFEEIILRKATANWPVTGIELCTTCSIKNGEVAAV
jgi:hypothetical protein